LKAAGAEQVELKLGSKGFTLIEIVMTLIVLSIAAVGVLSVFSVGITGRANPLILNQAVHLAQGEMDKVAGDRVLAGGFGTIATGGCFSTMLAGFGCSRTVCYVPSANLNDISACGTPTNFKHVTVTITQPTIENVSMDTIIANY
jgi:prepilin-type N-terminal cleavage/methylation domain-containing protein